MANSRVHCDEGEDEENTLEVEPETLIGDKSLTLNGGEEAGLQLANNQRIELAQGETLKLFKGTKLYSCTRDGDMVTVCAGEHTVSTRYGSDRAVQLIAEF